MPAARREHVIERVKLSRGVFMDTVAMMQDLLQVLLDKMQEGVLEWRSQSESSFMLPATAGTILVSAQPTIWTLQPTSGTFATTFESGHTQEISYRLAVFNPNGVEVGALSSSQAEESVGSRLASLFDKVKERTLDAENVISEVIGEVRSYQRAKTSRQLPERPSARRSS